MGGCKACVYRVALGLRGLHHENSKEREEQTSTRSR